MSPLISENKENFPVLIVDRVGDIGNHLAEKLAESSTVVLVSQKNSLDLNNVIHVPYSRRIPKVPDNLYSHIFVIDDGEAITLEALPSFFKKAESDRAIFSFCTHLGRNSLPSEIFEYKKSKILFLGDIFPQIGFFPKSYINKFLTTARNRGRIEIPQDGMTVSYPIFFEDALSAILEASFGTSSDRIFYIFPKQGVTLLALAHSIQKKNPDVKIDFVNEDPIEPPKIVREGKFPYETYPLDERIGKLSMSPSRMLTSDAKKVDKKDKSISSAENLRLTFFGLLFFLFLPLITTLIFAFLGFLSLDNSRFSSQFAKPQVYFARWSFSMAEMFSKSLLYETSFIRVEPIQKLADSIEMGKIESEDVSGLYDGIELIGKGMANEGISRIKDYLVFTQTNKKFKPADEGLINFIIQTINVWPQILGVDSNKSYLILLQNDKHLGGSGGKIEDFGILILQKGKIKDFKLFDSRDLDKNLKGHVEPPYALRRFTGLVNFHLMDAGFDLDFGEVAQSASFFVDLETGNKVEGVVRLNRQALEKLFGVNYKNTTDLDNSIKNPLQGKNLAKIILTKEFVEMLNKKDILFTFNDKSVDNIFTAGDFSSVLSSGNSNSKDINDFFAIFETDLNNSSPLGKRILQKTDIKEDGTISSVVSINLDNSNEKDAEKYLRLVVPGGAIIKKVAIDGQDFGFTDAVTNPNLYEAKTFKAPESLEIERTSEKNKTIFGFKVNVQRSKSKAVELTIEYPGEALTNLSNFAYGLHLFKQPGAEPFPFEFSISFPPSFKIYSEPHVSKILDRDLNLSFSFTK